MKHSERGQDRLTRSLQMLAEIEASSETPRHVEVAIMARWDTQRIRRAPSRTTRVVRVATTMAAGITLIGALAWQRGSGDDAVPPRPETTSAPQYTTVAVVGGPLMVGEAIRVVRMRVARSVLGELGIPSTARRGEHVETVDIDVLVGEDGVARGVRVPISEL